MIRWLLCCVSVVLLPACSDMNMLYGKDQQEVDLGHSLIRTEYNSTIVAMENALKEQYKNTPAKVLRLGNELKITYPSDELFGIGSTHLAVHSRWYLDVLWDDVKDKDNLRYLVESLTDDSGSQLGNQRLSEKRAINVEKYLLELGMQEEAVTVASYGGLYPEATNKTKSGRSANRRIVITVSLREV